MSALGIMYKFTAVVAGIFAIIGFLIGIFVSNNAIAAIIALLAFGGGSKYLWDLSKTETTD